MKIDDFFFQLKSDSNYFLKIILKDRFYFICFRK